MNLYSIWEVDSVTAVHFLQNSFCCKVYDLTFKNKISTENGVHNFENAEGLDSLAVHTLSTGSRGVCLEGSQTPHIIHSLLSSRAWTQRYPGANPLVWNQWLSLLSPVSALMKYWRLDALILSGLPNSCPKLALQIRERVLG